MLISFIHSFRSEWLKTKRSAGSWLVIGGAFLIPGIFLINRLTDGVDRLYHQSQANKYWEFLFFRCWEIANVMLLPLGAILVTSLIAQIEFRNNTWKQVFTTPQRVTTIFAVKQAVILVMLLLFLILFNLGIYLCGTVPCLVFRGIPFSKEAIDVHSFFKMNLKFFIDCLPIIALQYLLSLQFKNFLIPLGAGIGLYIASIIAVNWKYGYLVPYIYNMLIGMPRHSPIDRSINFHLWAIGYFVILTLISYLLFISKKEKG